ncbi:MAG: hypothetical protein IPL62_15230 [Caulobacteraceae bacterium]|nr:hypothetical protein [Caulobacteraceae bacterium]
MRGPQGTLFGNNTLGGAINVITRAPTDDFSGRFAADYASPDNYQTIAGSLSGPIIEGVLRGRVAAAYHSHDGFSTNTLAGGDARPLESTAVNGTLVWDAPDNAQLTLNTYYNEVTGSQTAYSSPSGPTDYIDDVQLNLNSIATYNYSGGNRPRRVRRQRQHPHDRGCRLRPQEMAKLTGDGDFGPIDVMRVIAAATN